MGDDRRIVTDRQGLEVLDLDECWRLMGEAVVGRIGFIDEGEAVILPVNHVVVDNTLAFLTTSGSKLGAAMMAEPVGFEVDEFEPDRRTGWSIVVRGVAEPVYDERLLAALNGSGLQPWATKVDRRHWVQIKVNDISGRRIR